MQRKALQRIYQSNVQGFGDGQMGAANGMTADGKIIDNPEAKEVWVGTTEAYAALLKSDGLREEAWKSTWGLYHVIYETKGYWSAPRKLGTSQEITAPACTCGPWPSGR
jgi:non-lysosomal glucosylceramidase